MPLFFLFFLISGFCSLVYEIVWLRLAMAAYGMNAPLVSTFLSVFMAGLGIGSLVAGFLARIFVGRNLGFFIRLYALVELFIALSALLVPYLINYGQSLLSGTFAGVSWGSLGYYWVSGLLVTITVLPWCIFMGATIPFAMAAIRVYNANFSQRSFSFLYLANVIGATIGTMASSYVMIELLGLKGTLLVTALTNTLIAGTALVYSLMVDSPKVDLQPAGISSASKSARLELPSHYPLIMLFTTGLVSMALEIVWIRIYIKFLLTTVYAFALILFFYFIATAYGSRIYRSIKKGISFNAEALAWTIAGFFGLLPLSTAFLNLSETFPPNIIVILVVFGIMPFCGVIGFLTPMLVDRWSGGDPYQAGRAYAVNIVGCIIGPLLAGFVILPRVSEMAALVLLTLPLFIAGVTVTFKAMGETAQFRVSGARSLVMGITLAAVILVAFSLSHHQGLAKEEVKRDYEAVVVASGEGMQKRLYVNGISMTVLTPITKMMAHLPLALLPKKPENSLVIAFGMGTTFRSCLSWGIPSTAVDLIPSVPEFFSYFHPDAGGLVKSSGAEIVIDDGRRFLKRVNMRYDVIVIDPPPPEEAAYSSLLYSRDFYEVAKPRLNPQGILQQWLPHGDDPAILTSVAKALKEAFPYVRVFSSVEGWGFHFLASSQPIGLRTAKEMTQLLPPRARADLIEWGPFAKPEEMFQKILDNEIPIDKLITLSKEVPALTDNYPVNEYFLLRRAFPKFFVE